MSVVSEQAQRLFVRLVSWECLGFELEPKDLLREVPLEDLEFVSQNIRSKGSALRQYVSVAMVELELLFKSGLLVGDWWYERKEERIILTYQPVDFPSLRREVHMASLIGVEI